MAAFFLGPNTRMPAFSNASTAPAASGSSGPTTTKSMACSPANATSFSKSMTPISTHSATLAMPALPGAQYNFSTFGLCDIFHAIACSRPPPPTINTFMTFLLILKTWRTWRALLSKRCYCPLAIMLIALGRITHSACSITLLCRISGVSPSSTSTAFWRIMGPVSMPPST